MRCGNCRASHGSVAEVRDCFAKDGDATQKQMSLAQALGRERVRLPEYKEMPEGEYSLMIAGLKRKAISPFIREMLKQPLMDGMNVHEQFGKVEPGRYALRNEDDDDIRFYFVSGKEPKYKRLYELIGAPGDFRQQRIYRPNKILARIAADPIAAFALYGLNVGRCGKCHSPLTQKHTRERGIGDTCYGKMGGQGA